MLQWLHWAEAAYEGDKSSLAKAMKVHTWILAFTKEDNLSWVSWSSRVLSMGSLDGRSELLQ
jgi:hypothetical protein